LPPHQFKPLADYVADVCNLFEGFYRVTEEDEGLMLTLYGTSACHLCELAEIQLSAMAGQFLYAKVDISGSDELFARYGLLIPVVAHPDGRELHWPFTPAQVLAFSGVVVD
jgi:hypothetical protein